jgi:hypothetical protein
MKLLTFFDRPELGALVYGILLQTARHVRLSYLNESEQDKVITSNLIPVDQVITACYPTVVTKVKRKEIKKNKETKPDKGFAFVYARRNTTDHSDVFLHLDRSPRSYTELGESRT